MMPRFRRMHKMPRLHDSWRRRPIARKMVIFGGAVGKSFTLDEAMRRVAGINIDEPISRYLGRHSRGQAI